MLPGRNRNGNCGVGIRPTTRLAIYLRDGFICVWCGRDLHRSDPFGITLDHLVPHDLGGSNSPSNLVTACRSCNCRRGSANWRGWAGNSRVIKRVERLILVPLPRELARMILWDAIGLNEGVARVRGEGRFGA